MYPVAVIAALFSLVAIVHGTSARAEESVSGSFVVVDLRMASDVATTLAQRESDNSKALIGSTVHFDNGVTWTDGRRCEARQGQKTSTAAQLEPNLSDLQIVPAGTDRRLNRPMVVDCLGRALSDIWQVLAVDDRVLVTRSEASVAYLVLEKPLASDDARRLKQGLHRAGFDPGPIDEVMNERTRMAVASYAQRHGAKYRFATGIVTRNVLEALAGTDRR